MCDECNDRAVDPSYGSKPSLGKLKARPESYMLQELKYKRDELFRQLASVQSAIEAVSRVE